jgi:hypothetical protein
MEIQENEIMNRGKRDVLKRRKRNPEVASDY